VGLASVGEAVSGGDGAAVRRLGWAEGGDEGCLEGEEGCEDGCSVGCPVGSVGASVGAGLNSVDGRPVGCLEG
jgi:hypothetical protein